MTAVIYPGTFDPVTKGHIDVAERACQLFDHVVVAVVDQTPKTTDFDASQRLSMANAAFSHLPSLEVVSFSGLLVHFARQRQIYTIVRGLRGVFDFEFESQLANTNRRLCAGIETVFLLPNEEYAFLSSTLVREIVALGGDISPFVPPIVVEAYDRLKEK